MDCCKNNILDPKIIANTDCCNKASNEVKKTRHHVSMSKTYYTRLEDKRRQVDCDNQCNVQPTYNTTSRIDRIKYQKYIK